MNLTVDDYVILESIAQGGMGSIYKAERKSDGRIVAFKVIRADMAESMGEAYAQRFRRELIISKDLGHPYVVRILDGGVMPDGSGTYIVMEYIDGENLRELSSGAISIEEMKQILRQIAEALSYIHAKGLVHRDIKPENIIVTDEGRAVLVDFGLAMSSDMTRITATEERPGTLLTMAPEQIRGDDIDGRCDIYALGVTSYMTLAGMPPYEVEEVYQIAVGVIPAPPPHLADIVPSVPPSFDELVMKCISLDREERYPTADALVAALEQVNEVTQEVTSTHLPVELSDPVKELPTPLDKPPQNKKTIVPIIFLLLCTLTLLGALALLRTKKTVSPNSFFTVQEWASDLAALRDDVLLAAKIPDDDTCNTLGELVQRARLTTRLGATKDCPPKVLGLYYLARYCSEKKLYEQSKDLFEHLLSKEGTSIPLTMKDHFTAEFYCVTALVAKERLEQYREAYHSEERLSVAQAMRKQLLPVVHHTPGIKEWDTACAAYLAALRYLETSTAKDEAIEFADYCRKANLTQKQKLSALMKVSGLLTAYRGVGLQNNTLEHLDISKKMALEVLSELPSNDKVNRWIIYSRLIGVELKLSNFKEANEYLDKVAKEQPHRVDTYAFYYIRANIEAYQGNYKKAVSILNEALKLDISSNERKDIQDRLRDLRGFAVFQSPKKLRMKEKR